MSNRFDGVETIDNLIGQMVGAASSPVLWKSELGKPAVHDDQGNSCVFDSDLAKEIWADARLKLKEMLVDRLAKSGAVDADNCEFLVGVILDEEE